MEDKKYILAFKDLCQALSETTTTGTRWRAVKQDLPNGDIKGLVYRDKSQITCIYEICNQGEVELDFTLHAQREEIFLNAYKKFSKKTTSYGISNEEDMVEANFHFDSFNDFERFVYGYFLPMAYNE